jgi:DNA-binding MarR family transcriptional regulator
MNKEAQSNPPKRAQPTRTLEQDVFLRIMRSADRLDSGLSEMLRPSELSATQYNVLRILRSVGDEGLPCGQIAGRMLTHDPDMTRLLDRLEKRGLIARWRDLKDRRVVRANITAVGRQLLGGLDEPILRLHRQQLGHLDQRELRKLAELLKKAMEPAEPGMKA